MILESIEGRLHTSKTELLTTIGEKLTIEHVMPVEWAKHWPLLDGDEEDREKQARRRDGVIHKVGNLTLLTKSLNPSVSNGAWSKKRDGLKASVLLLNQPLREVQEWNESAIEKRSAELFNVASDIWSFPSVTKTAAV